MHNLSEHLQYEDTRNIHFGMFIIMQVDVHVHTIYQSTSMTLWYVAPAWWTKVGVFVTVACTCSNFYLSYLHSDSNPCALINHTDEMLADGSPSSEIIDYCQQCLESDPVSDVDITIIIWHSIMSAVEWNKKEDLLAKQAMEHLQVLHAQLTTFLQYMYHVYGPYTTLLIWSLTS